MKNRRAVSICLFLVGLLSLTPLAAQAQSGTVVGRVADAGSGEALPSATVRIAGTALGTATSHDGTYRIAGVPAGPRVLSVSYIGYQSQEIPLTVEAGQTLRQDVALRFGLVEGEEIVVTAQLEGQARAINQQLASNTIVNVVSSDRIRELPDQNAAESLGRLPGVAVQRDAGEGQKVVIRGLSPKFNAITVNGERIPATDGEDRSVDLSMIAPDVLAGIEVFKVLTPDKDADAIGGTVNFVVRKAPERFHGAMRLQTGYNDHMAEYGQFKGSASLSNRFFKERVGLLLTGSLQRADRSSDVLDAEYLFKREAREGEERALIEVGKLNLADRIETRDRYSASLTLDVDLPNGEILLSSFWGRTDRDELRRRKRYRVDAGRVEYDLRDRDIDVFLLTNSLSGQHLFNPIEVTWRGSLSRTLRKQPFGHTARFQELAAFANDLIDDQGPELIPEGAKNNVDATWFQFANFATERVTDRNLTAQVDVKAPLRRGQRIAGFVKLGGKFRDKIRDRRKEEYQTPFAETDDIAADHAGRYDLTREGHILLSNFLDEDFADEDFLEGRYTFGPGLDRDMLNDFYDTFQDRYRLNRFVELDNYDAGESISAAYAMAEVHVGERLMLLPGFRYERTRTDYDAVVGALRGDLGIEGELIDTTGGQRYSEFLPMLHLRYKVTPQFDVRLAVTRSLSRPDYFNLVPFESINRSGQSIVRGNPDLRHTTAWNYDVFFSFYSRWGLFTLGGFYKTLDDIDYLRSTRLVGGEFGGFNLTEPENGDRSTVYGFEVELQTNLAFLPAPFDGVVLNANYAFAHSETFFPFFAIGPRSPDPPFTPTVIDTVRAGRIPGQARHLANLSVGYEKGGFSGRISVLYQGESLFVVGSRSELDGFIDAFTRWDVALSQRIGAGLGVFLSLNNLTNQEERAFLGIESFPTNEEFFGWTVDLGVRYSF